MANNNPASPARLAGVLRSAHDRPGRDSQRPSSPAWLAELLRSAVERDSLPAELPEPGKAPLLTRPVAVTVEIAAAEHDTETDIGPVDGWECEPTDAAGFAIDGWYVDGSPPAPPSSDGSPAVSRSASRSASIVSHESNEPALDVASTTPETDDVVAVHLRAAMGALCMERYARLAGWAALRPQVVGSDPAPPEDAARLCGAMAAMLDDLSRSSTTERAVERALAARVGRWSS